MLVVHIHSDSTQHGDVMVTCQRELAPLRVTVVVIHQASASREDGNPLKGAAYHCIKGVSGVALQSSTNRPDVAECKDVLYAQLGAF